MLEGVQYRLLRLFSRSFPKRSTGSAYTCRSKLLVLLGEDLKQKISGKCVVDYGCGDGQEAVELAKLGAREVVGIDIRDDVLDRARELACATGVSDRCRFAREPDAQADLIVCIDCFEHFADPAMDLRWMSTMLAPGGTVEISFGPTWYHPYGGHLFSVFPWAHLLFSERALIRWRSDIRDDGARRFGEVEGGLNQMTIRRFERLLAESSFRLELLRCVPIHSLRPFHDRWTREFTTATIRCRLRKDSATNDP